MAAGRKCEFCKEQALDAAMKVFWEKGFLGASLSELTQAMGINKPSMYAAFGNKEQLFVAATDYFAERHGSQACRNLQQSEGTVKERMKVYLSTVSDMQNQPGLPPGCFIAQAIGESVGGSLPAAALSAIQKASGISWSFLTDFFQHEIDAGRLSDSKSAEVYTRYTLTAIQGMASMARSGVPRHKMNDVIDLTLLAFED
ncbi:TetR/AcrR family transcriptional regulator [Veronia nyctiphanis]|nr:TetR/AcrR family transcriptional regulator [Veronia nyctiphanis]